MTKKMRYNWSGDGHTVFMDAEGKVYHCHLGVEGALDALHEKYGGKNYYVSGSGRTGAGYIEPGASDILMRIGYYRVDCSGSGHQFRGEPLFAEAMGTVFAYVPVLNGGAPDRCEEYPAVVTDGRRVAFCDAADIAPTVSRFEEFWSRGLEEGRVKSIEVPYIRREEDRDELKRDSISFSLLTDGFRRADALRFVDIRRAQEASLDIFQGFGNEHHQSPWMEKLGLYGICDEDRRLIFLIANGKFGFISDYFVPFEDGGITFPSEINGFAIHKDGDNLLAYRQRYDEDGVSYIGCMYFDPSRDVVHTEMFPAISFSPETAAARMRPCFPVSTAAC